MLSYLSQRTAAGTMTKKAATRCLSSSSSSSLPSWATIDPAALGQSKEPYAVPNLVNGNWTTSTASKMEIIHPLDRDAYPIFTIPDTGMDEIGPFVDSLRKVPKTGLHNPLKNPERYVEYGEITRKVCKRYRTLCI